MHTVFTLCSVNYLAGARVLADTLARHDPGLEFVVFLVDRAGDRAGWPKFASQQVVEIEQLDIPGFADMALRYSVGELNAALKPFVFDYLFRTATERNAILFLDPDIMTFQ